MRTMALKFGKVMNWFLAISLGLMWIVALVMAWWFFVLERRPFPLTFEIVAKAATGGCGLVGLLAVLRANLSHDHAKSILKSALGNAFYLTITLTATAYVAWLFPLFTAGSDSQALASGTEWFLVGAVFLSVSLLFLGTALGSAVHACLLERDLDRKAKTGRGIILP